MRLLAATLALALCSLGAAGASAQTPPTAAAEAARAKDAGDTAMDAFRFDEALAAYERAYALAPTPVLLYNRGRALQALGRYPDALDQLDAFAKTAPPDLKAKVPALDALIADVRGKICTVTLETGTVGARVQVGATVVGNTPLPPLRLNAGKATITVEAEGFEPFRREVELPGGGTALVHADLVPLGPNATLVVKTAQAGAEIWLDGRRVGTTSAEARVASGEHKVHVHHPEFVDADTTVVIAVQEKKVVDVPLTPRPTPSRWWLWTGLAVLVTAGAVAVGVGLSTRPADKGTIPPGQLRPTAAVLRF
jgi:hypothetical protein